MKFSFVLNQHGPREILCQFEIFATDASKATESAIGRDSSEVSQADCAIAATGHVRGGAMVDLILDQAARVASRVKWHFTGLFVPHSVIGKVDDTVAHSEAASAVGSGCF